MGRVKTTNSLYNSQLRNHRPNFVEISSVVRVLNPRIERKLSPTHVPLIKKKALHKHDEKRWLGKHDLGIITSFPVGKGKVNNG